MNHQKNKTKSSQFFKYWGFATFQSTFITLLFFYLIVVSAVAATVYFQIQRTRTLLSLETKQALKENNFNSFDETVEQVILIDQIIFFTMLVCLVILVIVFIYLHQRIKSSIDNISDLLKKLALGEISKQITPKRDEFSEIIVASNRLMDNFQNVTDFMVEIGEGNFETDFKPSGKEDILGNTLLQMREKLKKVSKEDKKRNWATEGYAKFADIIRIHNHEVKEVCSQVLYHLIEYLGANQGGIFVLNEDERTGDKVLDLTASYAFDRKKFLKKQIAVHTDYADTLIGQVFLEKEKIYLTDIPQDYLRITSGLGEAPPHILLIVPMKFNDKVEGVMELASFKEIEPHQIEFIERICESLASAILSLRVNEQTKRLLEESQMQSSILQTQEEEMRQNMEELQATQENMRNAQKELMEKEANLSALVNSTNDSLITLDKNYKIMVLNNVLLRRYKGTNYEGIKVGVNALDYLGSVREEWKAIYDRGLNGERYDFVMKSTVNNEDAYRHYYINPIQNDKGEVIGVSVLSRDVTKETVERLQDKQLIAELQDKLAQYEEKISV